MAKVTAAQKAAAEAQAAELKATAVLEANEAAQAAAEAQAATQDALEMEVFEDAPVADLDTPVAGEEKNGAEVPQNEGPDETGNELQPGDETDPDPVEIPEEEMQVGDIQDESQDESQDEVPEDPGAELSGKYDFSAKRQKMSFLQNRRIKK
jgi:hypothetical protein